VFLLFLFVLGKFAWAPLASGLDAREARIRTSISEAEAARLKAEKMLADHAAKLAGVQDEVKAILAEARRDADQARQNILGDTQREVAAMRQRTLDEIGRARDQALKELFDAMAGQVVSATEHVLGRSLNDGDQNRLIDEALSQFSRGGNGRS
jgi:F-type H+-transporting ATPase subunit b